MKQLMEGAAASRLSKAVGLLFAAALSACPGGGGASAVCSKSVDLSQKAGSCSVIANKGPVTGEASTCSSRAASCDSSEQSAIVSALDCLDKLSVCDPSTQTSWESQLASCNSGISNLSPGCKSAVFGGALPGQ